jgi:hypothetical protein
VQDPDRPRLLEDSVPTRVVQLAMVGGLSTPYQRRTGVVTSWVVTLESAVTAAARAPLILLPVTVLDGLPLVPTDTTEH